MLQVFRAFQHLHHSDLLAVIALVTSVVLTYADHRLAGLVADLTVVLCVWALLRRYVLNPIRIGRELERQAQLRRQHAQDAAVFEALRDSGRP